MFSSYRRRVWLLPLSLCVLLSACDDSDPPVTGPGSGPPLLTSYVESSAYLHSRFYRLDLPAWRPVDGLADAPGRPAGSVIDLNSVRVFRAIDPALAEPGDVAHVAAFRDTTGLWPGGFTPADDLLAWGDAWREIDLELMVDEVTGEVTGVDLLASWGQGVRLAVVFDVLDGDTRELLYRVGDRPGRDEEDRIDLFGDGDLYYRMKALKLADHEYGSCPRLWRYMIRNVYSLGVANILYETFDLGIEIKIAGLDEPRQDPGSGLPWIRIFGLDRMDLRGIPGADGLVDIHDPHLFDLQRGLLYFPAELTRPFAAAPEIYEALADTRAFDWATSGLSDHLAPELYEVGYSRTELVQFSRFRFVITVPDLRYWSP